MYKGDGHNYVWRLPKEKHNQNCLILTFNSGRRGVMVWGCFTKDSLGSLIRLYGKVTSKEYTDTFENKENFIFRDDNALPFIQLKWLKKWKEEKNLAICPKKLLKL